ncbi:hypothetical protein HYY73_03135 [Candidatus Woesearchaeota archaeon]|nr:hypothetical protein [Candidatus Woesearchaeota archaeon]
MVLEEILKNKPGIENDERRARDLRSLLGPGAPTIGIMEFAVRHISDPIKIKQFYVECVDYFKERFNMITETAEENVNHLIGYATVSYEPHRDLWIDTLPQVYHPIFNRERIKPEGKVISGLEVRLADPKLTNRFIELLNQRSPYMFGGTFSVNTQQDVLVLTPTGHLGLSEKSIAYLYGILDSIMGIAVGKQSEGPFSYQLKWNIEDMSDSQAYWEKILRYEKVGNNWFLPGLNRAPHSTKAWVIEAFIGQWPTPATNGTPAPYGLHITFNESGLGSTGIIVSWTFVGDQVSEFLEACKVSNPEKLLGKQFTIFEDSYRIVGIEASTK